MSSLQPSQVGDASRVALARLALDVVASIPGVAGTDAGPGGLCVTADPPFGVLQGVSVIAQADGRYEVDLCLVARIVPLLPLGDHIRRQLRARAARAGLAEQLGAVNVEFARALSAGETILEVAGAEPPEPSAVPMEPPASIGPQTPPPLGAASTPIAPPEPTPELPPPDREPRP